MTGNYKYGGDRRKAAVAYFKFGGAEEVHENLSQDVRCTSRFSNLTSPKTNQKPHRVRQFPRFFLCRMNRACCLHAASKKYLPTWPISSM